MGEDPTNSRLAVAAGVGVEPCVSFPSRYKHRCCRSRASAPRKRKAAMPAGKPWTNARTNAPGRISFFSVGVSERHTIRQECGDGAAAVREVSRRPLRGQSRAKLSSGCDFLARASWGRGCRYCSGRCSAGRRARSSGWSGERRSSNNGGVAELGLRHRRQDKPMHAHGARRPLCATRVVSSGGSGYCPRASPSPTPSRPAPSSMKAPASARRRRNRRRAPPRSDPPILEGGRT